MNSSAHSSAQNIIDADPFGFGGFGNTPERKVIVLWDYENCPVPKGVSGLSAIRNIREAALKFGSIDRFEVYCDWSNKASANIRNDFSISGVKGLSEAGVDQHSQQGHCRVDMMVYALERPRTTTILLISGDRDHAYAISTLRNRGYPVKLLAPSGTLHSGLQALADLLSWNSIFKSDLPPTELVDFSEEEDEDEYEDADAERKEEEGMETEETAQVQVGVTAVADETAQVLLETDDEGDYGEPAFSGTPQSESVATLAPAEIFPMWIPAELALPSKIVPLELLSARAQEHQEERPRSSPLGALPSHSSPTWSQTVPSSYVGGSSQPGFGASFTLEPQTVPPSHVGWNSQPRFWGSVIQQPQTVPLSYHGGESNQPRFGASSIQQPHIASSSYGGGSSPPEFGASVVQHRAREVPLKFLVLVQELEAIKATGSPTPRWNQLGKLVKQRLPSVVSDAGVNGWRRYLLLAEKEGIIEIMRHPNKGRNIGKSTISLRI